MSTLIQDRVEQHRQYWRLQEIDTLIDEMENMFSLKVHIKTANDYKNILFSAMGKCFITFHEIICLVLNGYPDGALALSRNLYEQFIIVNYIYNHKKDDQFSELVDDYFMNYDMERYKALRFEAKHCVRNSELYNNYQHEINELGKQTHQKLSDGNEYWWSGKKSFFKIEEEIWNSAKDSSTEKELYYLHVFYKRACASIHANFFGNSVFMGVNPQYVGVDTSPQSKGHEVALYLSVISFSFITKITFEEFDLKFDSYKDRFSELMTYYRTIIKETY